MKTPGTHNYYVYILTNKDRTVLYTGVTHNLVQRIFHHQNPPPGTNSFTARYNCFYLLFYERYEDIIQAIAREKQIKGFSRLKKNKLIEGFNPHWKFLNDELE